MTLPYINRKELVYDDSAFTVVGSPTISADGIASNLSSSNKITSDFKSFLVADNWRMEYPISATQTIQAGLISLLGVNALQVVYTPANKRINFALSSNGTSWDIINTNFVATNLDTSRDSLFVIEYTGTQYILNVYQDGVATGTGYTVNNSNKIYAGGGDLIFGNNRGGGAPTNGSIDFKQFSITVDGEQVLSGGKYNGIGLKYKDVYTSAIEFNTQIIEKQQGEEQRYPVWTYPKRTFTLKFDKNAEGRQAIEDFYIDVMTNYNGQFLYVWDEEKGGNGQTYTCWIDSDSLAMSIYDYGFCETELKFITIDRNPITPVASLDFYHRADADYNVAFNVIKDQILSANYRLRQLWQLPRRSWTLKFDKNAETRKKIEEFFISKRGKFRYFQWQWKQEYGGDDNIYI